MSNEQTPNRSWILYVVAFAFLLLLYLGIKIPQHQRDKARTEYNEAVTKVDTLITTPDNIAGNYFMTVSEDGDESRLQGTIEEDALGQWVLHIYDEYEPRTVLLNIENDGTISSEDLGTGVMTYKKNIDKTTITFTKDNSTCVLTK